MKLLGFKSLRTKILLPVLIISTLGFLTVALSGYLQSRSIIMNNIEQLSLGKVESTVSHIDGLLEVWKSEIEVLSATNAVKSMDFQGFKAYIDERKEIFNGYEMFLISDTDGNYKATLGLDGNISDRAYFPIAMSGITVISDPVTSKATNKPIIVIAAPIKDDSGKVKGVLAGTMELRYISDIVDGQKYGDTGYAYMINRKGLVLAHPVKEKIFKENLLENDSKSLVEIIKKMTSGETGVGYYNYEGVEKIVGYSLIKATGWPIAMTINYDEVNGEVVKLGVMTLIVGLTVVLVLVIILTLLVGCIIKPLLKMTGLTKEIASGDLTVKIDIKSKDETGILAGNFNDMVGKMREILGNVSDMSSAVASSTEEMMASSEEISRVSEQTAAAVSELAKGASEQAMSTEKGNSMIKEIVEGLSRINEDMTASLKIVEKAMEDVNKGQKAVNLQEVKMVESKTASSNAASAVSSLSEKSNEIGQIIEAISSIAEQTNLLSLNAAIEAARAGEQGKGFAVVAEEVRKLAEQSSQSVKKIGQIIKEVQSGIGQVVTEMDRNEAAIGEQENTLAETVKAFKNISEAVSDIASNVKAVASSSDSLNENAAQASDAISDIASISQQTASGTQEVAASTEEQTSAIHEIANSAENLSQLANRLQESIRMFKI